MAVCAKLRAPLHKLQRDFHIPGDADAQDQDEKKGRGPPGTERSAGNAPIRVEKQVGSITFRYETVRCGKENCSRCPHGPYWYAYWKEGGRTRSRYIGRALPDVARESYEEKRKARLEKQ